jgi:integrase
MMLYKWRHHQRGDEKWEPELSFSQPNHSTTPRDYLTRKERRQIRDAALEYTSVPSESNIYGEERDRWRAYLAQRFEKPKSQITKDDWERANSWKYPTLVWVSLDAGLRPIEVKRARTSWVNLDNNILRIPQDESSKNDENWRRSLQERTVTMLDH